MATGGPSRRRSNPAKGELSDDQMNSIYEAFAVFDVEKSGKIASQNLKLAMRALGFEPRREEIKKIISEYVKDESDYITLEQFVSLMTEKIADKGAKEEIFKAFCLFDDDHTGKITFKNLKRVAEELGETLSEEELREMITEADQDNDGEINQDEFLRIMKKTCLY
ncbi:caltractin-like [Daphnia pulex]|uniref:caltractin-like n=1 Tax=Daphnia pulex TaxID=6669 RepID=UPI001EDFB9B0|nr:caltractin-like [Daphnia pulex]